MSVRKQKQRTHQSLVIQTRTCPQCKRELILSVDNFHRNRDGFKIRCKDCINDENRERWAKNIADICQYKAEWQRANRKKVREYQLQWQKKVKEAGYPTRKPKKTCKKCGEEKVNTREFFHKTPCSKDGLRSICKDCVNAKIRKEYQANKNK